MTLFILNKIQIIIKDLKGLTSADKDKVVFCLFEMNGCDKLSTNRTQVSNLRFTNQASCLIYSLLLI